MSTYGMPDVSYGEATGTYGDLWGGTPGERVPSPTFAVGPVGTTSVVGGDGRGALVGGDGRSAVVGPPGTTLTVGA